MKLAITNPLKKITVVPPAPTGTELAESIRQKRAALIAEAAQVAETLQAEIALDLEYVNQRRRAVEEEAQRILEENARRAQDIDSIRF